MCFAEHGSYRDVERIHRLALARASSGVLQACGQGGEKALHSRSVSQRVSPPPKSTHDAGEKAEKGPARTQASLVQ